MENPQFDDSIGGDEHLPHSANSLRFAASRSIEIAAMTDCLDPNRGKLIFQNLPVHMRRRVMSHNSKRMPRNLRLAHTEQIKKNGNKVASIQKRPSRKHRRRPAVLLDEYTRRQKRYVWLETHIWHAKRFHMIERWGHRLAYAPCDKAFRACYRASSAHCLIQDISYYTPIQIMGEIESVKSLFQTITNSSCGLGVCAKAYVTGNREGAIHLYKPKLYPFGYIGKANFIWTDGGTNTNRTLWLFVHPSQSKQIESVLIDIIHSGTEYNDTPVEKKRKIVDNFSENIKFKVSLGTFNRYRLTGPNSHAVLVHTLKCVDDIKKIKNNLWLASHIETASELYLREKYEYWHNISLAQSPSQLTPNSIIGLIVRDPRLSRPSLRTKAKQNSTQHLSTEFLINTPTNIATSPLWDTKIHETIKKNKMTNTQYIQHVTNTQLVPGEVYENDPALQSIPVILVQRSGSQDSSFKKIGYNSGWDIILPSGYGLPFWHTFIMFGARAGGLRESESLAFESGECYLPPDSDAGKEEEKRIESTLREKYFKLPPSKRVNYIKLAVLSPFKCPWKILLSDWSDMPIDDFYVLRDTQMLNSLQDCIKSKKREIPKRDTDHSCLVAVYLQVEGKGRLNNNSLICLPKSGDVSSIKTLFEPLHTDPNEKLRKMKRIEHRKTLKQMRRKRIKLRKKGLATKTEKRKSKANVVPSEYVKTMRELSLPSDIKNVRHSSCREVIGFMPKAAYSFTEARSCGVGYVTYNALGVLLNDGHSSVLVRTTSSRKYRLATFQIIIKT